MTNPDGDDRRPERFDDGLVAAADVDRDPRARPRLPFLVAAGGAIAALVAILVRRGRPEKFEAPGLNAEGTDVAVDTLELTDQGVETRSVGDPDG
jgi:hypothetical protein